MQSMANRQVIYKILIYKTVPANQQSRTRGI